MAESSRQGAARPPRAHALGAFAALPPSLPASMGRGVQSLSSVQTHTSEGRLRPAAERGRVAPSCSLHGPAADRLRAPAPRLALASRPFFTGSCVPSTTAARRPVGTSSPSGRPAETTCGFTLTLPFARGWAAAGVGVALETIARSRVQERAGRLPARAALLALAVAICATELPYSALGAAVPPLARFAAWAALLAASLGLHLAGVPRGAALAQSLSRLALPGLLLHLALRASSAPLTGFLSWILYPLLGVAGPALLFQHLVPALRSALPRVAWLILDGRGARGSVSSEDEGEWVPAGGARGAGADQRGPVTAGVAEAVRELEAAGAIVYEPHPTAAGEDTWGEWVGYDEVKAQVEESLVSVFQHAAVVRHIAESTRGAVGGPAVPRAVLFSGKPGVGKTLCARILARRCAAHMVYISAECALSKWHGESETRLARLFKLARSLGDKVFVFVDEIDSLVVRRESGSHESHGTEGRLLSIILRQLDGFDSAESPCVLTLIGATNRPQDLDEALTSRFEVLVEFGLPNEADRAAIAQEYARHLPPADLARLARASEGLSARNIRDAAVRAERRLVYELARGSLEGEGARLCVRSPAGMPLPSAVLYQWALEETRAKEGAGAGAARSPSRSIGFHFDEEEEEEWGRGAGPATPGSPPYGSPRPAGQTRGRI
eukprot:tig00000113_g5592.t1